MLHNSHHQSESILTDASFRFRPGQGHQTAIMLQTDHMTISCIRKPERVSDLRVECFDMNGDLLGTIQFEDMSFEQVQDLVHKLVGLGKNEQDDETPHVSDPLPDVLHLRNALTLAEEHGVDYSCDFGTTAPDIASRFFDTLLQGMTVQDIRELMHIEKLAPGIYHVHMPNEYLLASSFLRISEHSESPQFALTRFSREDFKNWYSTHSDYRSGGFSYYEDWGGFNVPRIIFESFFQGEFDPLEPQERALVRSFEHLRGPFYVIGTSGETHVETLRHEIAHSLFNTNAAYQAEVLEVLATIDSGPIIEYLKKGYHQRTWVDEVHAYLVNDSKWLRDSEGIDIRPYKAAIASLNEIFERYWNATKYNEPRVIAPH